MPIFGGWITTGGSAYALPPPWQGIQPTSLAQTYVSGTVPALYQTMLSTQTATATAISYYEVDYMNAQYLQLAQNRAVYSRELTALERAQQELARQAARRQQEEYIERLKQAHARSRELLLSHLDPAQRKTFEQNKWFVVEGRKTKQKYRIRTEGYAGNIDVMAGSKVTHRLCVHCSDVPLHDHHLAQKLWLEHDEERILKIANRQAA